MCKQTQTKAHTICDTGLGNNPRQMLTIIKLKTDIAIYYHGKSADLQAFSDGSWLGEGQQAFPEFTCFVEAAIAIEIDPEILLGRLRKRGTGTDSKFITHNN